MIVAIVGSRDYENLAAVQTYVRGLPPDTVVISGGAIGVDSDAIATAVACGLRTRVYLPDYVFYSDRPRFAPLARNRLIAAACDQLVAFWNGMSSGTAHVIREAELRGKPVLHM